MKSTAFWLRTVLICLVFLASGCKTIDYTLTKRSEIENRIQAVRAETEKRLQDLNKQELELLRKMLDGYKEKAQFASDLLFKGYATYGSLKTPTRPELVMGHSIQQSYEYLPAASFKAQAKAFEDLKTELDELRVSTEELKKKYEAELAGVKQDAAKKDEALKQVSSKLETVDKERVEVLTKARATENDLNDKKDELFKKSQAEKDKELAEAKSVQAIKIKASSAIGILALLCLAGAIWSPVMKEKFGIAAGILSFAAIAIWYIEGWMVAVAAGVGFLALMGWAAYKYLIVDRASTNVYRAIQAHKETDKENYETTLKPLLEQWMTVYDKKTGKPIPDTKAIKHVDEVLMKVGDK